MRPRILRKRSVDSHLTCRLAIDTTREGHSLVIPLLRLNLRGADARDKLYRPREPRSLREKATPRERECDRTKRAPRAHNY